MVRRSVMAMWRQPARGSQVRKRLVVPPRGLVVLTPRSSRLGGQWRSGIGQQLGGGLVEAHHRPVWVVGFGVEVQHVLHGGHELSVHLGDAPLLLPPRLEDVFLSRSRTVSYDRLSTNPNSTAWSASNPGSSGHGPRAHTAQGNQVGFDDHPTSGTDWLEDGLQHAIQSLLSVWRARDVSRAATWFALVSPEQDARPRITRAECWPLRINCRSRSGRQLYPVFLLYHGLRTSRTADCYSA